MLSGGGAGDSSCTPVQTATPSMMASQIAQPHRMAPVPAEVGGAVGAFVSSCIMVVDQPSADSGWLDDRLVSLTPL